MTSRASCIRSRAWRRARPAAPCAGDGLDVRDRQVRAGQDDRRSAARRSGSKCGTSGSLTVPRIVGYARRAVFDFLEPVLAFIDELVIPDLRRGRLSRRRAVAVAIESVDHPDPVGAGPAVRRVPRRRGRARSSRSPGSPGTSGSSSLAGDDRATRSARSSPTRIGAWGGRPFLERWGRYLLITPARDRAGRRVLRAARRRRPRSSAGCSRSSGRCHQLRRPASPGCRSAVHRLFTCLGSLPWSRAARLRRRRSSARTGRRSATSLKPFEYAIARPCSSSSFVWLRSGAGIIKPRRAARAGGLTPARRAAPPAARPTGTRGRAAGRRAILRPPARKNGSAA